MKPQTDDEIRALITCPKCIMQGPRREMKAEGAYLRNEMLLRSMDDTRGFSVFMRIHRIFQENFSIGLVFTPEGERENMRLFRCNGAHGEVLGGQGNSTAHCGFHIHMATMENIRAGHQADRGGLITRDFASYQQALHCFLTRVNIVNAEQYFPGIDQPLLPFGDEDAQQ